MATATKQADIRYRVELKGKEIVVYKVHSSDDSQDYEVTVFEGKVSGCSCPATKPCYHMRDVQAREDARKPIGTLNGRGAEVKIERAGRLGKLVPMR